MNRKIRKGIATLATLAMAMSLSVTAAFAAAPIGNGVATTTDTQLTIPKGVTFINDDAVTSYGPGITFTYTLAPATVAANTTVKDSQSRMGTVHAGPVGGLTLASGSLAFPASETFTTSSAGIQHAKDLTLNFDATKFARAGIYRYVLTDTTPKADLYAAGITRDDNYVTERYIDVFVKRAANGTDMEVYGYALKVANDSTDATATPATEKDPGYVAESNAEDGTPAITDRYKTYNVTLTKQVEGALGDYEHEFPFAITVANSGKNYYAAKGDINAAKAATADALTSKSTFLKHTEVYTLAGLSPHATVAYQETNDTTDLYAVTAAGSSAAITVTDDGSKHYSVAAENVSTYPTANSSTTVAAVGATTNYSAVTYTNTLEEVSPTGFVQHFGMLFMILAAGIAMMIVGMKTTEDEEL